jgi:hypothetical protein
MFHVKQPYLTLDQKHLLYHGFQRGAFTVRHHVRLAKIERSGNELCFTVLGNTHTGVTHIHVPRILVRDRWIDAIFRPYDAGQEAGAIAASWWKRNGFPGEPPADHEIDADFKKWMLDSAAA